MMDIGSVDIAYTLGIRVATSGSFSTSGEAYSNRVPSRSAKSAQACAALETRMSAGEPLVACSLSTFWNTSSLSRLFAEILVIQGYFFWKSRKIGAQFSWSVFE